MSKFKFIEVNKDLLPKTKGRRIDGHRFYEIEGKNYPSITTVLNIRKKQGLVEWRKNVWIGYGATILKNVSIGNNCVIGAGSVVHSSIPDNCVVSGSPAKIIKKLN